MRDLALLVMMVIGLPLALRFPFVGLYLWEWFSLMDPHQLAYGFARGAPFNFAIAACTIVGWIIQRDRTFPKASPFLIVSVVFVVWMSITTLAAPFPEVSVPLYERTAKTMLLMYMIPALIKNRTRVHGLIWIIAISLGHFGVKGGGFTLASGGNYIVWGPPDSMIADNNSLALALIMTVPLLNYLRVYTTLWWLRLGIVGVIALTLIAVLGSYSRGGLIAMAAMLAFLWLRSPSKLVMLLVIFGVGAATLAFMPQKYMDRISTISSARTDESFRERLDAWHVAWDVALDRPLGAGFAGPIQHSMWDRYLPGVSRHASHSIYFMVLGEHGFIGLIIYLIMCGLGWLNLSRIVALTRDKTELQWARDLATALQISAIGFFVGGAALPVAYYDGFLTLLAIGVALRTIVEADLGHNVIRQHRRSNGPATAVSTAFESELNVPPTSGLVNSLAASKLASPFLKQ